MRRLALCFAVVLLWQSPLPAQETGAAAMPAEFHAEPDGTLLATITEGTVLRVGERRAEWRQAVLEGWIWAASVQSDRRNGHDLSVAAEQGENLRAEPNGRILARLRTGMLLDRLERDGNWIRVEREGWVRALAIPLDDGAPGEGADTPDAAGDATADGVDARVPEAAGGAPPRLDGAGLARTGQAGARLLASPDGDTLGTLRPLTPVDVVAREGDWARIRLDAWAWAPSLAEPGDTGRVLTDVAPADLASNPDGFRGRLVEWTVQFIALDEAEEIRIDFSEGEPFILARWPDDEAGFVYIAVPPERVDGVRRFRPLQEITVLARVRTARSALMRAPVLELVQVR